MFCRGLAGTRQKVGRQVRLPRGHSSSRCRLELEPTNLQPMCVPPLRHAEGPPGPFRCHSTAAAHATACRGRPSSANSVKRRRKIAPVCALALHRAKAPRPTAQASRPSVRLAASPFVRITSRVAMLFAPCPPRRLRQTPRDMMMPFGRCCRACSEERAALTPSMPGKLPPCRARWGGLGLQSAEATAPAAYWAFGRTHCLPYALRGQLHATRRWRALSSRNGACTSHLTGPRLERLPQPAAPGAGDWPHSWQYHASRTLTVHSRDLAFLPSLPSSSRALRLLARRRARLGRRGTKSCET